MLGIFLGVAALITVLSVMNGFGKELRDRILGVVSHVTISQTGAKLKDWKSVARIAKEHEQVTAMAPYVLGQGMLNSKGSVKGVMVRGILPDQEAGVSRLGNAMKSGALADLKPGEYGMIIGSALTWKLDIDVGSYVSLIVPQALATPAGIMPRFRRFKVVGVFDVGMYEYDSGLTLIHMDDAAALYRIPEGASGLRLKIEDLYQAPEVALELQDKLGYAFITRDWTREHANFFRALKIEKRVMLVILLLIVAVAAFNIVSTLVMVVTDKQSDIAILRTLGLKPSSVMAVFMVQGTIIGVVGTALGVLGGVALAANVQEVVQFIEGLFKFKILAADVYYITDLPSDIHSSDVIVIAVSSFVMSIMATIYPAWRASRVQPAQALRYE